jgi:hypothetical protein
MLVYSWKRLGPVSDRVADQFYDTLFEIAPAARAGFVADRMPAMRRALIARIDAAIAPSRGAPVLVAEAPRDLLLGAPPAAALEALLQTLRRFLADGWSDELAAAWAAASPRLLESLTRTAAAA